MFVVHCGRHGKSYALWRGHATAVGARGKRSSSHPNKQAENLRSVLAIDFLSRATRVCSDACVGCHVAELRGESVGGIRDSDRARAQ